MAWSELPAPGSLIGGRYRIEALLGQGGMGAVFAAVNDATGRSVAIKWMLPEAAGSPEAMARFMAEARATAKIEHPNVIAVLDVGQDGGSPFLVMERLRGQSLADRLTRGRLSVVEALDVLIPACRGVAEAHAEGVIHRDLKPDNIFLCEGKDGSLRAPKVLDFGISKLYEREGGVQLTQTGIAIGTPNYMSPEQLNAPREVDARFDVYAMGIVLYQTLAGRLPYDAEGLFELVQQIARGNPTPLCALAPDVPPELEATVMRAMHVRPELRHATMRDLITELETIRARFGASGPAPLPGHVTPAIGGSMTPAAAIAPYPTPAPHAPATAPYAPPTAPYRGPPAPHAPPPGPPRATKSNALLAVLAIGGALALVLLAAVGVGVALYAREGGSDGWDGSGGEDASDDPLRPRMDLAFSGDCQPRFEGTISVTTNHLHMLSIASMENGRPVGSLNISPGEANLNGSIQLDQATFNSTRFSVNLGEGGQTSWGNWRSGMDTSGRWPITGTLTFRSWDPARGIVDVTFDGVTLQNWGTGTLCRVQGRVQTFGLTWGT